MQYIYKNSKYIKQVPLWDYHQAYHLHQINDFPAQQLAREYVD